MKLVDSAQLDSDLTSIANAIRSKTGGSSQIAFPSGFVSGIGGLADPSGITSVASDVASGKIFMQADGTLGTGTASGGGGSSYTLLHSEEITVSTTSTSSTKIKDITIADAWTSAKIIYVRIRDKAGKRSGYFYGSDAFIENCNPKNGGTATANAIGYYYTYNNNAFTSAGYTGNGYGVFGRQIADGGVLSIFRRYNSALSLTINGTFTVEVYALDWPGSVSPFA